MSSVEKWKPNFRKWYEVDKTAYKFVFEQAEKRMEEVLSNSEAITDRAVKVVATVAAMFAFFIGFLIQKEIPFEKGTLPITLFIIDVLLAIFLLFPKEVRARGIAPKTLLPLENLDADEPEYQEQLLYYSAIVILQDNIDFMRRKNRDRAVVFMATLILSLILFVVGTGLIVDHL